MEKISIKVLFTVDFNAFITQRELRISYVSLMTTRRAEDIPKVIKMNIIVNTKSYKHYENMKIILRRKINKV